MQPEVGAAAFVGNGKTIAADPELASSNNGKADASRSDDDDAAVASAVRADTGDRRIVRVNNRAEGMRSLFELLEQAFPADAGKAHRGMHGTERAHAKASFLGGDATGLLDFSKCRLDSDAQGCRTGDTGPEKGSLHIFDARPATRAAAIDADEEKSGF